MKGRIFSLLALLLASCSSNEATLILSLDEDLTNIANTQSYRLVIQGPNATAYDSGCQGTSLASADLEASVPAGEELNLELLGYTNKGCRGPLALVGVRGAMVAQPDEDLSYYVFVALADRFTPFPYPNDQDLAEIEQVTCASHDDCSALDPAGTCSTTKGHCTISYGPFNLSQPRAFHTATSVSDGRVLLAGGVGHSTPGDDSSQVFLSQEISQSEMFDPSQGLFGPFEPAQVPEEERIALHSATFLGLGTVALIGGTRMVALTASGDHVRDLLFSSLCGLDQSDLGPCAVPQAALVDLATNDGVPRQSMDQQALEAGIFLHASVPLATGTGTAVMLVGGRSAEGLDLQDLTICLSRSGLDCQDGREEGYAPLIVPRAGATATCLGGFNSSGLCEEGSPLLVLGGQDQEDQPLGEMIYPGTTLALSQTGALFHHQAVLLEEGEITMVLVSGGVRREGRFDDLDDFPTSRILSLQLGDNQAFAEEVELAELKLRALHTATRLEDGRVLVAGGIGPGGEPLNTAEVIDQQGEIISARSLFVPRFGHTATLITAGPLRGGVLVAGGLTIGPDGAPETVGRAEIFLPADMER